MLELHRIASRLLNRPLLIEPSVAEVVYSVLAPRFGAEPLVDVARPEPRASRLDGEPVGRVSDTGRIVEEWYRRFGSTALVTVEGELVNRGAWVGASSGVTSYEGITFKLAKAAADPQVDNIVLDIDSPGGEAVGAMEAASYVRAIAAIKPVTAYVNGMAASAGYALASGATRIVAVPSALVGSIGTVLLHMDVSREMEMKGRKPTLIHAGAHKVDGHPFAPLPDAVRADLQAEVNAFYADFVATVVRHRAGLTDEAVRGTEARLFKGADAVAAGLADAIGTLPEILSSPGRRSSGASNRRTGMDTQDTIPKADHERGVAAARTDERARCAAIVTSSEAVGREPMAAHLAFKTSMSADDAIALLATSPKAAPTASAAPAAPPAPTVPTIAQRAAGPEIGGGNDPAPDVGAEAAAGWSKVVDRINKRG